MYVCLCKGITEEMLESVAGKGLRGKHALQALGVGSDCGTCLIEALDKISQREKNKTATVQSLFPKQVK